MPARKRQTIDTAMRETLRALKGRPYASGYSLPGAFYTDPDWVQTECEELFRGDWFCVGRLDEVTRPGDYFCFDFIGEPLLVVRGRDGELRVLSNLCRHRGTVIASGSGNASKFMCPYHHWSYDTGGRLLNAPRLEEHADFDRRRCRLPRLKCATWQGFIFASLDPDAGDFRPGLEALEAVIANYHLEQMSLHFLTEEVWDINWKCLLENFMEGYHLTPLHRSSLHPVNPSRLCRHMQPGERHFGYRVGFASRLPEERVGHPDLSAEEMDTCVMFALPPGLAVGVGSDYCSFLCLRPQGPAQVRVKMGLFFHGDRWTQPQLDAAIELFQRTMEEDRQVLLRLQQGLGSRFHQPGPLAAPDLEGTIWDFYQYLARRLGADGSA